MYCVKRAVRRKRIADRPEEMADRPEEISVRQNEICFEEKGELVRLEYLTFPLLEGIKGVRHLFTTRLGGVSEGMYASLNLSFERGDDPERVLENYRRIAKVTGCEPDRMVVSKQTHTTNIRRVTRKDMGMGVTRSRDFDDVDGLVTDERGIGLVTLYADCVPLYFVDPEHGAIGLAHSGWRGTVQRMGAHMVKTMEEQFHSRPGQIYAAVGPSICQECYEVSEEVAEAFFELQLSAGDALQEIQKSGLCFGNGGGKMILPGKESGKYQLDLWLANALVLRMAGISLDRMSVTDICTCHNPDYLFSHRASGGKRGNLGAFLMLEDE